MPPETLSSIMTQLEELWHCFDELYASLGPEDWSRPHGKDWVFADLPYHMAYYDRDNVAEPLAHGEAPPAEKRIKIWPDLAKWNAERFAERPAGQTVEQSLAQMRAARDAVRQSVAGWTDADLERPTWEVFFGGWAPARFVLGGCRAHTWSEFIQFRLILERETPAPSATATHGALGLYMSLFPLGLNRELAATTRFTVVMETTEAGVGPWTIAVADGKATVTEGPAAQPDLVITQSPETFIKTLYGMHDPATAMASGEIRVSDFGALATFGGLLPPTPMG